MSLAATLSKYAYSLTYLESLGKVSIVEDVSGKKYVIVEFVDRLQIEDNE